MSNVINVAAIQALPVRHLLDPQNAAHAADLLKEAARLGADLACFPEAYPATGEEEICRAAREAGIFAIAGFLVREGGETFNESILIDSSGRVTGRQRKVHPVPRLEPFGRGRSFVPMDTPWGKIGIGICIDGWGFPEAFYRFSEVGVGLLFNPCLIFKKKPQKRMSLLARVLDYKIPIVAPNNAAWSLRIYEADPGLPAEGGQSLILVPPAFQTPEDIDHFMRHAASTESWIVSEAGREEQILTARIDLAALRRTRALWTDCFGACAL